MKQSRHAISMLLEKYRAVLQKTWRNNLDADAAGLRRCRRGVCAAALFASLAVSPGLAAAETITYDGSPADQSKLKPDPVFTMIPGDTSLYPAASVTGNTVTVTGGRVTYSVFGGFTDVPDQAVTNNIVDIINGETGKHAYGGYSVHGDVTGNAVTIRTGGSIESDVYGGYSVNSAAGNNTVSINGQVTEDVHGGYSDYGDATGNAVTIDTGGSVGRDVYGGRSGDGVAGNNTVIINGQVTTGYVYGGLSSNSTASGNAVTINTNGDVGQDVYGGYSGSSAAGNNTVTISGGIVKGDVYGGKGDTAADNHVSIGGLGRADSDVYGGYASNAASGNTVDLSGGGSVGRIVYGGYADSGNADSNTVDIRGDVGINVLGGFSASGTADGNRVAISGEGRVRGYVSGGQASGAASGNTVTISSGVVDQDVLGGQGSAAAANSVSISGGAVSGDVYGGYANNGNASGNTVTISSAATVGLDVYGGYSANSTASDNTVTISGGTLGIGRTVFGGVGDTVTGNTVNISGDIMSGDVYGGNGTTVTGNTVNITGGAVDAWIYGGAGATATGNAVNISGGSFGSNSAIFAGGGAVATGNTLTISGSPDLTNATLYGTNQLAFANWSTAGNILNVKSAGVRVKEVAAFQYYNFYLPANVAPGSTMLSVTTAVDLTGATIGVGLAGAPTVLQQGDRVTLINAPSGLTAPGINGITAVRPVSIARDDTFTLTTDTENLYATAISLQSGGNPDPGDPDPGDNPNPPAALSPRSKALLEGRMAGVAQINQGADLLTSQGIASARSALDSGNAPSGFFAVSGSHNQYQTGSHVDVNSLALVAGVGKKNAVKNGSMLNGLFLEYGRGSYSTYNSFVNLPSARGDGDTDYFGVGYLMRNQRDSGRYLEGSVRAGRASTDFHSGDLSAAIGKNVDYDISSPYYGLHIAFGKEREVGQNRTLDTYVKAIWTHQNGSSATVTGDRISFDAVNSHRWQLGARLLRKVNDQTTVRTGLAYQYEFDGKAGGTANGMSIDNPSLKGGSAVAELGLTIAPKRNNNAPLLDLSLQGFAGKCKGIAGSIESTWKF